MESARIRNDRQKNFPRLHRGVPFFLPKVWGQAFFSSLRTARMGGRQFFFCPLPPKNQGIEKRNKVPAASKALDGTYTCLEIKIHMNSTLFRFSTVVSLTRSLLQGNLNPKIQKRMFSVLGLTRAILRRRGVFFPLRTAVGLTELNKAQSLCLQFCNALQCK